MCKCGCDGLWVAATAHVLLNKGHSITSLTELCFGISFCYWLQLVVWMKTILFLLNTFFCQLSDSSSHGWPMSRASDMFVQTMISTYKWVMKV